MVSAGGSIPKRSSNRAGNAWSLAANLCRNAGQWLLLIGLTGAVQAKDLVAPMDKSQWYISASIFECSIVHDIPLYGKGIFYHEAGEPLRFYTTALRNPMKPGQAALVVEASDWRPGAQIQDLGFVDVIESDQPIHVEAARSMSMMQGLLEGMFPTFTRQAVYKEESIRVRLNSINFASVYNAYLECVSGLLPVNFRQVERTRVHFAVDKSIMTKDDKTALDNLILYVKADSTVSAIYVDGHTDSSGRRIYNRRLSKDRAEVVTAYLIKHGIAPDIIQTRYHGESYPVIDNKTKSNKAKNRRSTVRLIRGDPALLPEGEDGDGE